ncbi:hypothetical protein [uncultured Croceitalea sp.]|uniref:hypothetical protein n=1 Tax=uncultured Croceitalea sp. TaxID=1798908 RepID=UPI0033056E03
MRFFRTALYCYLIICLSSCYSVRFQVENAQWEPADTEREDAYAGYNVYTLDTVVTRKLTTGQHYFNIPDCSLGKGLHTVEYRTTFGGMLLNAVTFGRKKKVKIKYVCIK